MRHGAKQKPKRLQPKGGLTAHLLSVHVHSALRRVDLDDAHVQQRRDVAAQRVGMLQSELGHEAQRGIGARQRRGRGGSCGERCAIEGAGGGAAHCGEGVGVA